MNKELLALRHIEGSAYSRPSGAQPPGPVDEPLDSGERGMSSVSPRVAVSFAVVGVFVRDRSALAQWAERLRGSALLKEADRHLAPFREPHGMAETGVVAALFKNNFSQLDQVCAWAPGDQALKAQEEVDRKRSICVFEKGEIVFRCMPIVARPPEHMIGEPSLTACLNRLLCCSLTCTPFVMFCGLPFRRDPTAAD